MRITKPDTTTPAIGTAGTLEPRAKGRAPAPPVKTSKFKRPGWSGFFVLALITLAAAGCSIERLDNGVPSNVASTSAPRFLALGDSYTIGESVAPEARWPVQLAARLRADGGSVSEPEIIARTGWTTTELDAGIDAAKPRGTYELVSVLVGVNDQYRGGDAQTYRGVFRNLLHRSIDFAGDRPARVIVVSIPDWGVTPFAASRDRAAIAAAIDAFNAVNRDEAAQAGVRYVDITAISRRAAQDGTLVAPDGLHPSAAMYSEWVNAVLPEARAALESPATH